MIPMDDSLDYGGNFAHMLGFDSPSMQELMRMYITIHRWAYTSISRNIIHLLLMWCRAIYSLHIFENFFKYIVKNTSLIVI